MIKKMLTDKIGLQAILAKGGITFLFRAVAMALSFLLMWFSTNYFGNIVFGLYSLGLTILQFMVLLFALGIPNAFVSFSGTFNNPAQNTGFLITTLKPALIAACVPLILLVAGAGTISSLLFQKPNLYPFIIIAAVGTPVLIIHELLCYYFVSVKRFTFYGLFIFIIPNVFFGTFLLISYYLNAPPFFTLGSYVMAYAINIAIGFIAVFYNNGAVEYPGIGTFMLLRRALPMMVSGVFLMLLNWTDILILGRYETEANIGIYNAAFKVGYLVLFFVTTMNVIILPRVSELYYQKDMVKLKKVVNKFTRTVGLLTLPIAFGIIFFSSYILSILGKGFETGSTALVFITLGGLFNALTGNVDQILNMTNNHKVVSIIFFIGFLLNVLLNFCLIPSFGIKGAAAASLLSNILVNTIFVIVIRRKLGFWTFI